MCLTHSFDHSINCSNFSRCEILLYTEQILCRNNRSNILLIDLIWAAGRSTITKQDSPCDFLVEHNSHLSPEPAYNVYCCSIDDVLPVKLLLLINCCRSCFSLSKAEELFHLLISLNVASCSGFIFGNISKQSLNSREWEMLCSIHYCGYPSILSLDELRMIIDSLCIREEQFNVADTIISLSMSKECITERSTIISYIGESSMAKLITYSIQIVSVHELITHNFAFIIVEYVVFHFGFFSFFIISVIFVCTFLKGSSDKSVESFLLLFVHSLNDFAHCLFFCFFVISHFGLLLIISMLDCVSINGLNEDLEWKSCVDHSTRICSILVHNNIVDVCSRISSGKNKTYLSDLAMHYIAAKLLKFISVNRQGADIAMHDKRFSISALWRVIKISIGVNTFWLILEKTMTKNLFRIIVSVSPYQRHGHPVVVNECVFSNCSSVGAFNVITSSPATKVIMRFLTHFE